MVSVKLKEKNYEFEIKGTLRNFQDDSTDCLEDRNVIINCLKEGVDIGETFGMLLGSFETKIQKFKLKRRVK